MNNVRTVDFSSNSVDNLLILSQSPDGLAIMTKKAWEAHKEYVWQIFQKEEILTDEERKDLYEMYLDKFEISPADKNRINFLTKDCKLKINETHDFISVIGYFQRF